MPATDPPSQLPREVLDHLIDLVAEAKTCLLLAAMTPTGSRERALALARLRTAVLEPRSLTNQILDGLRKAVANPQHITHEILDSLQGMPQAIIVELRVCEMAISKLEAGAVLRQPSPRAGVS